MSHSMKYARGRSRRGRVELSMTPMIDVVFLLLVFFVLALKPQDILSALPVSRPAAVGAPADIQLPRIVVGTDGYRIAGRHMGLRDLSKRLARIRRTSEGVQLVIACEPQARHDTLIQLLDTCAHLNITDISLFSM